MSLPTAAPPPAGAARPTPALQLTNFVVFQGAWFGAVLGAAHQAPLRGTAGIAAAIAWHLAVSARPMAEARLVASVCAIGFAVETLSVALGFVAYPSGQPVAWLAPYWMVALWGLLAIALNVTMRWLRHRPWRAAAIGAVAGPASFVGGVRLGGAEFVQMVPALVSMAIGWAVLMPALVRLSVRFDGVSVPAVSPEPGHG